MLDAFIKIIPMLIAACAILVLVVFLVRMILERTNDSMSVWNSINALEDRFKTPALKDSVLPVVIRELCEALGGSYTSVPAVKQDIRHAVRSFLIQQLRDPLVPGGELDRNLIAVIPAITDLQAARLEMQTNLALLDQKLAKANVSQAAMMDSLRRLATEASLSLLEQQRAQRRNSQERALGWLYLVRFRALSQGLQGAALQGALIRLHALPGCELKSKALTLELQRIAGNLAEYARRIEIRLEKDLQDLPLDDWSQRLRRPEAGSEVLADLAEEARRSSGPIRADTEQFFDLREALRNAAFELSGPLNVALRGAESNDREVQLEWARLKERLAEICRAAGMEVQEPIPGERYERDRHAPFDAPIMGGPSGTIARVMKLGLRVDEAEQRPEVIYYQ